ncbi:hypothetical protein P8452_00075 [Trifolium repens]|nr:hypothetical protein P8452_00075 [Trifolium repens]
MEPSIYPHKRSNGESRLVAYIDYPWLHYMEAIFALALSWMAPRGPQYNFTLRFAFTMLLNAAMANVIT